MNKKVLIIIIIVSSIILIAGGVIAYVVVKNMDDNCEQNQFYQSSEYPALDKPIIYLYPEEETEINVKVSNSELLTHTYPKYNEQTGWNVIAQPNGDLTDTKTGRNLYSLYWEGKDASKIDMTEGFVIKGEETIEFLEEKLAILGLTEREANEFIIYWLPKLESNKYNYIIFRTTEEIEEYMQLEVVPKPDSIIRVYMDFKSIEKEIEVKEQQLKTPTRKGYTLVEWGGRELI